MSAQLRALRSSCLNQAQRPQASIPTDGSAPPGRSLEVHRRQVLSAGGIALCCWGRPSSVYASLDGPSQGSSLVSSPSTAGVPGTIQTDTQYDAYAAQYDQLDAGAPAEAFGIPKLRQALIGAAYGQVLEVAIVLSGPAKAGTGINLPLYNRQQVHKLTGLDLSQGMLNEAQAKLQHNDPGLQITLQQGDVERLPFGDNSFDCVVDTFSMCVFPNPLQALKELARVLSPDGKLLLLEHSRSSLPLLGWYQDLTMPAVAAMGKGCKWNQDLASLLAQAHLKPTKLQTSLAGVITLVEAQKM